MKSNRVIPEKTSKPSSGSATGTSRSERLIRPALLVFFLFTAALLIAFDSPENIAPRKNTASSTIALPSPKSEGELSLEETLNRRGVERNYSQQPLSLEDLSQLLWAGCGMQVDAVSGPTRTAPSAGGLYPQELFVFLGNVEKAGHRLESGVYRYEPHDHRLVQLHSKDHRQALARAALNQSFISQAPAVIVLGGVVERTAAKYGERGAERYVFLDAGHSAQNISLQASALGLASALVGAFSDNAVASLLPDTEALPIYIIPVGYP